MARLVFILLIIIAVLLGALMMLRRNKPPPPPENLDKHYDDWEKEDKKRGWKDSE